MLLTVGTAYTFLWLSVIAQNIYQITDVTCREISEKVLNALHPYTTAVKSPVYLTNMFHRYGDSDGHKLLRAPGRTLSLFSRHKSVRNETVTASPAKV